MANKTSASVLDDYKMWCSLKNLLPRAFVSASKFYRVVTITQLFSFPSREKERGDTSKALTKLIPAIVASREIYTQAVYETITKGTPFYPSKMVFLRSSHFHAYLWKRCLSEAVTCHVHFWSPWCNALCPSSCLVLVLRNEWVAKPFPFLKISVLLWG